MPSAAELKSTLYDRGEFDNCLNAVEQEQHINHPETGELLALAGWCYYRKGDFTMARQCFQLADPVPFAVEGLAYLAVYVDKNDSAFAELARRLGDRINVQNALVIRARDPDSTITLDQVMEGVLRFNEDTVEMANLCHNAGRVFFHKVRDGADLVTALGLFEVARVRYGVDRNWHHRGELNYWRSRVLEDLLDKRAALEAARDSLYCWTQQVILDPKTERHKTQWENAVVRLRELSAQ